MVGELTLQFLQNSKIVVLLVQDTPTTWQTKSTIGRFTICKSAGNCSLTIILAGLGSDHALITWELALQEKFTISRKMYNWHQVEWTRFRNRLREKTRQFSEPMLENPLHIDEVVTRFTIMMQQIVQEQVPIKRICHFSKEWWTPEIKQLRSMMRRPARRWQKYRTLPARAEYLESRRRLQKEVRRSKQFRWRL